MFANREEAGDLLALKLLDYEGKNCIVLAIPRGGVVVARRVAERLKVPLDLIIPRKIGAPQNPEFALGAVTLNGTVVMNPSANHLGIPPDYIQGEVKRQKEEIKRRMKEYRGDKPLPSVSAKIVILIDDGIATGSTVLAAIATLEKQRAKKIILAVPVAPPDTVKRLRRRVDQLICLETPEPFYAVGQFYQDFTQTTDGEVVEALKQNQMLISSIQNLLFDKSLGN